MEKLLFLQWNGNGFDIINESGKVIFHCKKRQSAYNWLNRKNDKVKHKYKLVS